VQGSDLQAIFEEILPEKELMRLVDEAGFQTRERKLIPLAMIRAMVISAAADGGGRQAAVATLYFQNGAPKVTRGGFYRWFNPALERVMSGVSQRALDVARRQPVDLPGWLGEHVTDWHIVDSTTIRLDDDLLDEYPGAGEYAALKIHKRYSVGRSTTVDYDLSPAREHDHLHLELDETWKGLGLLADLGYASFKLIRDCDRYDVRFVIRLKENWKPKVQHIARGTVTREFFRGSDLDGLLAAETLVLDGKVVDADIRLGSDKAGASCRLVGVPTPEGHYRFYLTNLPPRVGPRQIADLYRVRWEIERSNKLDKSYFQLDDIDARKGCSVRAMIHAAITSSICACLIAHRYQLEIAPTSDATHTRTQPPLHPQLVARQLAIGALSVARLFELKPDEARAGWDHLASLVIHTGQDPNWRSRPSILDQLRGWAIAPGRPRKQKMASSVGAVN
jgi:putative transposase